jgi:hypothetical protein
MMYSCHAMGVRGEIVELGRFLMGTVWHGVSFRLLVPRTVRIRCPARTPTRPFNGTRLPKAASRRPTAKVRPDDLVQSRHKGRGRRALHPNHSTTLATLRTKFCPVADSCKQRILANRTPDQTFFAFAGCTTAGAACPSAGSTIVGFDSRRASACVWSCRTTSIQQRKILRPLPLIRSRGLIVRQHPTSRCNSSLQPFGLQQ